MQEEIGGGNQHVIRPRICRKRDRRHLQLLHPRTGTARSGKAAAGISPVCAGWTAVDRPARVGRASVVDNRRGAISEVRAQVPSPKSQVPPPGSEAEPGRLHGKAAATGATTGSSDEGGAKTDLRLRVPARRHAKPRAPITACRLPITACRLLLAACRLPA